VRLLLSNRADPWSPDDINCCGGNRSSVYYLTKARLLNITVRWLPPDKRETHFRHEIELAFDELKFNVSEKKVEAFLDQ